MGNQAGEGSKEPYDIIADAVSETPLNEAKTRVNEVHLVSLLPGPRKRDRHTRISPRYYYTLVHIHGDKLPTRKSSIGIGPPKRDGCISERCTNTHAWHSNPSLSGDTLLVTLQPFGEQKQYWAAHDWKQATMGHKDRSLHHNVPATLTVMISPTTLPKPSITRIVG